MEQGQGHGSGMFAMFADAHKAYDQVWRDALYLILYTQGVRGKLLGSIQSWLNGAVASPLAASQFFFATFFRACALRNADPVKPCTAACALRHSLCAPFTLGFA